jgi:hypothetical protein
MMNSRCLSSWMVKGMGKNGLWSIRICMLHFSNFDRLDVYGRKFCPVTIAIFSMIVYDCFIQSVQLIRRSRELNCQR